MMQLLGRLQKMISFLRDKHQLIFKGFIFLSAILLIVYLFPKQAKFKYEFKNLKGKPWNHENLIAPFDFAIRKSTTELENEKADVVKNIKPYFVYKSDVAKKQKEVFENEFNAKWKRTNAKKLRAQTLTIGKDILDSIYRKGIIQPSEKLDNLPADASIYVLQDNIAEEYEVRDFFTIASAFSFVQKRLTKTEKQIDETFLLPLLENSIVHSIIYDNSINEKVTQQALESITLSRDKILKNQSIISKGEIVDADKYQILESLKAEYEEQSGGNSTYYSIILGQLIVVSLCIVALIVFLNIFRKDIYENDTKVLFILLLIILQVLMVNLSLNTELFDTYMLPFAILPIIIRSFYDTRIALIVYLISVLIISFMLPSPFEFVFIQILGGIVTIFSIVNMRKRSQIFITSFFVFITYSVAYVGISIIEEGGMDSIELKMFSWLAISSLLTLFSYPLIFVFEKIFGFVSDVSILELSDTNGKLLRKLATTAPGTFQHSLQVANLAEDAIYTIGGNALMVRTGALFHDIGKMENPLFFIENQTGGVNPHEDLSYEDSAAIIIEHVIKGIEIAKKYNIPEQIIDFIRTHHGTSYTGFFYKSFKNDFPEEVIDEEKFRYPGPIPFSKETAVLMMADSVEAASRSLKKYDAETLDKLVESIINRQIEEHQFINANITFKDIKIIKNLFKKKLMNIYHVRVEYPR